MAYARLSGIKHQREDRELEIVVRNRAQRVGHGVEQREGKNAANHAVAQPLELLADYRVFSLAIANGERDAAREVGRDYRDQPDAVEHPVQFLERDSGADRSHGKRDISCEEQRRGEHKEALRRVSFGTSAAVRETSP